MADRPIEWISIPIAGMGEPVSQRVTEWRIDGLGFVHPIEVRKDPRNTWGDEST